MFERIGTLVRNRLFRTNMGKKAAAVLGRKIQPDKWVFIIGCYNSGTTLLQGILSDHPEIGVMPGEGVAFTDMLARPEQYGWTRMWSECLDQMRIVDNDDAPQIAKRIKRQWSMLFDSKKPVLIEKSIVNATRMRFFQEHFKPAYFIYIVRNGFAVAEGIRRKAKPGRWNNSIYNESFPIELCARQWRISEEVVQKQLPYLDRVHTVMYEDLVNNPEKVLKKVTDFIGISPFQEGIVTRERRVHGRSSEIFNMNDKSLNRLSSEDVRIIQAEAGKALSHYAYSSDVLSSDS